MITETCNTFGSSLDRYDYDTICDFCGDEARYDADDPCCDEMAAAIASDEAERLAAIEEAVAYEREQHAGHMDGLMARDENDRRDGTIMAGNVVIAQFTHTTLEYSEDNPPY